MEMNQEKPTVTEQSTGTGTPAKNTPTGPQSDMQPDRTFTRDEVTRILKRRIDRYQNQMFKKYGVENSEGLDSLFEKAKGYDDILKSRDEYAEKVAFMGNNINPDRYDDIRTYFKGKGLQFSEDELKRQLETHAEWVKQAPVQQAPSKPVTTITPVGTPSNGPVDRSEQEIAKKVFGSDLFD